MGAGRAEEFAALLRELKERSGLSYGALAKRLHLSASTLHRYCQGTAVPVEYAPVERLARVCRATPQELVELHRRWVLADAVRALRPDRAPAPSEQPEGLGGASAVGGVMSGPAAAEGPGGAASVGGAATEGPGGTPLVGDAGSGRAAAEERGGSQPASGAGLRRATPQESGRTSPAGRTTPEGAAAQEPGRTQHVGGAGPEAAGEPGGTPRPSVRDADTHPPGGSRDVPPDESDEPVVVGVRPPALRRKRRRNALLASGAVAAVLVAAVVIARPWAAGGTPHTSADRRTTSAPSPSATQAPAPLTGTPTRTPSAPATSASPTSTPGTRTPTASRTSGTGTSHKPGKSTTVPFSVLTRPYVYDNPCAQHFLVDSGPAQVGPPATEDEAPRWAAVYGAVSSGEQRVGLTVQGTGAQTVVLEGLHLHVESKSAPLAWNDYSMGVGCGGAVESASFDADLDAGSPVLTPRNGQRGFPYKVSESDPEVFYVTAHTKRHDVRWYLTLEWSSGDRHGTVRVDSSGADFRTSADVGRPGYDYPLGWSDWIARTE